MQYRPPNASQEGSKTNPCGSVSDSLGRLTATTSTSECVATNTIFYAKCYAAEINIFVCSFLDDGSGLNQGNTLVIMFVLVTLVLSCHRLTISQLAL